MYEKIPVCPDVWAIEDGTVRMYLLNGGTEAALIDTGYGEGDLRSVVQELTQAPVCVINTHCHGDHISGNKAFHRFFLPQGDCAAIRSACPADAKIETVKDEEVLSVGRLRLRVIAIPGHTPGSIALLDETHRLLFSGDSFAKQFPLYMQFPGQNLQQHLCSLKKLQAMRGQFDKLMPMHGLLEIGQEYMEKTIQCCAGILNGSIAPGEAAMANGATSRAYWFEDVAIFYN